MRTDHTDVMERAQKKGVLNQTGKPFIAAMAALFLDDSIPWGTKAGCYRL
jgi:hypothetical protein